LLLCLAGYAIYISLAPETAFGEEPASPAPAAPKLDHILLEVSNLKASIAFYRDFLGLRLKSESDWFVMLESDNVGMFLRNSRWDWEKRSGKGEQLGLGMYPHLEVSDAAATVEKARKAGYRVSRSQGNMILALKHSLLTLMVIPGHLYLRRKSLPVA
jgi:catechol 2,3-dioxygenase-like lactoylglutathione lyase family enzyme